jgi:hypothetical protein
MNRRYLRRNAFTLIEAMVAISITALAGSVLLLAVETSLETTSDGVDRLIAEGIADQILDEISTKRFMSTDSTPTYAPFGHSYYEAAGVGRSRYDDTDDYDNYSAYPLEGVWGESLGTGNDAGGNRHPQFTVPSGYFDNWRARIDVYFVNPNDPSQRLTNGTSYYRAAEVVVEYVSPQGQVNKLADRRRVYAYIPPPAN